MADVMEHVAYLSQEIGPRPAGTEEEQQAALYITEHMQKEAGLPAVIEDFTGISDKELPRAICSGVTLAFTVLAIVLPVVALPAAIIALFSAAIYVAEAFDKPILSRFFSRGVSQNVVARYEPGVSPESGRSRRRKVILVAHYDSGKTRSELSGPVVNALPIVKWVVLGAFVLAALVLLLSATVFLNVSGAVDVVLNVVAIVAAVIAALPLVQFVIHKTASYNDGANCNASGVAALMEVAARVGRGRTDMSSFGEDTPEVSIHGEAAARESGLVPEGASISYEAKESKAAAAPSHNETPVERLAAAKAAVAALSGKPVSDFMSEEILNASIEINMPDSTEETPSEPASAPGSAAAVSGLQQVESQQAAVSEQPQQVQSVQQMPPAPQVVQQGKVEQQEHALPAWFVEAQKKAKRSDAGAKPVQRSRYADALDAAVSASNAHFAEANNAVITNTEQRIASMSDGIVEVSAPEDAWQQAHPEAQSQPQVQTQVQPQLQNEVARVSVVEMPVQPVENLAPAAQTQGPAPAPVVTEMAAAPERQASGAMNPILPEDLSVPDLSGEEEPTIPAFLVQPAPQPQPEPAPESAARVRVVASAPEEDIRYAKEEQPPASVEAAPVFVETVTAGVAQEAVSKTASIDIDPAATQAHQPISLPNVDSDKVAALDTLKQRAPLAEVYNPEEEHAGDLRSSLPFIDPAHPAAQQVHRRPTRDQLRSALPSFSGILPKVDDEKPQESSTVSLTGSFAPVGATSSSAPVGDELLDDVDPEEIYIDDADDSYYEDPQNDAGQFAAPGYVEMPKSRMRRLLDRFHRKSKEDESTPQEWLDVDESFDARSVGAARGGWESFRYEQEDDAYDASAYDAADTFDDFSDEEDFEYEDDREPRNRSWHGGAFSRVRMGRVDMRSGKEDEPPLEGETPPPTEPEAPEMQKIYQFRNPDIDTEVWFVALGAELGGNNGMRAFIAEHEHELRGSIIIELEALGAGEFCMIDQEGGYRVAKTSSRMKRYTRKASQATGVSVDAASMKWKSSTSSYAITHGLQAMHLVGMENGKPASYGSNDDTLDNVDAELLARRADYVMHLLKNI